MALCCLIVFMAQMATTVYLPSLPTVMAELGMTQGMVELSISAFVVGAALPVLFWGWAADRWGRRGPLLGALSLFAATSLLLAAAAGATELLVLRTLQGVAAGGAAIIARIIVRDNWQGDELARRLSVLSIAFITALGGGQFAGGLIARYSHWQSGFLLMAATSAAAIALSFSLPMDGGRRAAGGGTDAQPKGTPKGTPTGTIRSGGLGIYLSILVRPGFFWPACAGGLGFATTVTLQEVSPFLFEEKFHLPPTGFGTIGLLIGLAYFSGALLVNRKVAHVGGRRLMQTGARLIGAATGAMLLLRLLGFLEGTSGLVVFTGLYCLTTFGQAVLFPNSMATAVSDCRSHGAHAMALAGFLQQTLAGVAATASVLFHSDSRWAPAVFVLGGLTLLQVSLTLRRS
ncbi:MAG: multidrug effflux MFS transporter [Telmatospirillum sp.]|nr:multidrug effflux MFS transporter [Telmatospirillum sp.]